MNSKLVRQNFFDFFQSKQHKIVPSAPMVVKDDPTLMFTNAGMNQFKEIFLDTAPIKYPRIANSQKCLRVSGKHNDLEEVGHDTYHHTMFEMLGNWSFGDYFKKESIDWAWEFLTQVVKLDKSRLYASVFMGDAVDGVEFDSEAYELWKQYLPEDHILKCSKKDNFWEMGDSGPCGPCSEIHVDLRTDAERAAKAGRELVNNDHPQVVEIWNLVFIQYNRKADGKLVTLSSKHVDTGMGFERLCMALQSKKSNYDTDVFQPIIQKIASLVKIEYGSNEKSDIAMRVVADHLRAVSFAIADGQLPGNAKSGYVIRRILRRAIRYNYTFLNQKEALIYKLVETLKDVMGDTFTELAQQQQLIENVIKDEEQAFLRTLESGIRMLDGLMDSANKTNNKTISGKKVFELYDTYGFPLDLTQLILRENNLEAGIDEFNSEMEAQKARSRKASESDTADWVIISDKVQEFVGYDTNTAEVKLCRYRKVVSKKEEFYHLVFDKTPFYGESGGQVGDKGYVELEGQKIEIFDTIKENNLSIHLSKKLPSKTDAVMKAFVNIEARQATENNHSATHLLHLALRSVLGTHVEQKGSLVNPDYLRFDFSHFQKISPEQIEEVEFRVNAMIRQNINLEEFRKLAIDDARKMGAMALFGEKYGENVRVVKFGDSVELCGGTHVAATGNIGYFKIISEASVAAGIRRIQAYTAKAAEKHVNGLLSILKDVSAMLDSPIDIKHSILQMSQYNESLRKKIEEHSMQEIKRIKNNLKDRIIDKNGVNVITEIVAADDASIIKDLAYQLKGEINNLFCVLASEINGKANITVMISESVVADKNLHAGKIVGELAKIVEGGGGGQPYYATAGGKNPAKIIEVIEAAKKIC